MLILSGENVWLSTLFPWTEDDIEIIARKNLVPSSMSSVKTLTSPPKRKISVICVNGNRLVGTLKIDTPMLKTFNNSKKFLIMDIIVLLGFVK